MGNRLPASVTVHGKGETVLVVDDEEVVRDVTRHTLESFGFEVLTAEDGVGAVVAFSLNRGKISAVITDIMMPVMDGIALIRALRKMEPNVAIIAVSGMLPESINVDLASLGIGSILKKPFTAQELIKTLHTEKVGVPGGQPRSEVIQEA
jgi:CheY-like chemotaxis protein